MPKGGENVKFKNYERKIKWPFMIYGNFKNILVPEDNGKQNPERVLSKQISKKYRLHLWLKIMLMKSSVSLFAILLMIESKNVNIVVKR